MSTMWKRVGQDPRLWKEFRLKITKKNIDHFQSAMDLPICSRIKSIEICPHVLDSPVNGETPSQLLKAIASSPIRKLYIGENDLSMIQPQVPARTLREDVKNFQRGVGVGC